MVDTFYRTYSKVVQLNSVKQHFNYVSGVSPNVIWILIHCFVGVAVYRFSRIYTVLTCRQYTADIASGTVAIAFRYLIAIDI